MTTGALLLLSALFLGTGVHEFDGLFSVHALVWMTLAFIPLLLAFLAYLQKLRIPIAPPTETMLVLAVLFFLYIATFKMPGAYVPSGRGYAQNFFLLQALLITLITVTFLFVRHSPRIAKQSVLVFCMVIAIGLRVTLLSASPAPRIDVFNAGTSAAESFLEDGKSPYVSDSPDMIPFYYPPLNFYLQLLSSWLTGDIRAVYILAEVIFAFCLFWAARRSMGSVSALLLTCLFLFHPRGLYILELGWTEPPILTLLGLSLVLFVRGKRNAAAVSYGFMLSLKQYLAFFLIHWFLLERNWKRFALMLAAAAVTVVPFLFFDPANVLDKGFFQTLRGSMRFDSLTYASLFYHLTGISIPKMTGVVVGLIASVWTFALLRRSPGISAFLFSSAITTFALFLFGAQAFANYYYVVSGIVLLLIAYHAGNEEAIAAAPAV